MKYPTNAKKFTFEIFFGLFMVEIVIMKYNCDKNAYFIHSKFKTFLIRFSFRFSVSSWIEFLEMYKVLVFFDINRIIAEYIRSVDS